MNNDLPKRRWPSSTLVWSILFLSRLLTTAERNYWPTELEIAGFVWVLKKVRHLMKSFKAKIIIQTDHSAILNILQQSFITLSSSIMRLNLRLVRASQFFQQFKLDVHHKPGKEHIIPNALSRFTSANICPANPFYSELDAFFVYNTTLIEIHPTLVSRILAGYNVDAWWSRFQDQVQSNNELSANTASLPFVSGSMPPSDADPYLAPHPKSNAQQPPCPIYQGLPTSPQLPYMRKYFLRRIRQSCSTMLTG